ncbi:histidine kinase [Streptosporangium sp. NPDC023963]|uniref:sensor histidine kinase n=1 Tax=Streptosporangium sp. NPDC023963 TaxID=3155608 RepID=UPI00341312A0
MSTFLGYLVSELSWTDLLCSTVAALLAVVSFTLGTRRHTKSMLARSESAATLRERRRIARNLHDGVGHGLTVIALQARRLTGSPATAHHVAQIIEETVQATLADLRGTLTDLRHEPPPPRGRRDLPPGDPVDPGDPGEEPRRHDDGALLSARLTELAGRFPFPDLAVRLRNVAAERHVPPEVARTAFRVAQEALTNALKHNAGPVHLEVCFGEKLSVSVVNETHALGVMAVAMPLPRRQGGGTGLRGLSERVAEQGGHLESGPLTGGGFVTRAVIPVTPAIFREDEPCGRSAS